MSKLKSGWKTRSTLFRVCSLYLSVLLLVVTAAVYLSFRPSVHAQTPEELAQQYAPVLHFTQGEKFYPTSVDYIISSSVLKERYIDGSSTIYPAPQVTPSNLGNYPSPFLFLDNKYHNLTAIADDYASKVNDIGYYAYVHVVTTSSSTVIQYWLFYAYNNGPLNDHQGDIEVVELFLNTSSGKPETTLYSQHLAGENAGWGDVEKENDHPVVYVAQGSHANYFRSYQGKIGIENDIVGSDGLTIKPENLTLVMLDSQSWLGFAGRWGYWGTFDEEALGMAGPEGPVFNQNGVRWDEPETYLDSTFSVGGTYFILAWLVANFLLLFIIYILVRGGWKVYSIVKLKKKGGLLVKKFLRSRGAPALALGLAAIVITLVALALPWYTITASAKTGPLAQEGGVTLMTINGINGVTVNMFALNSESASGYGNLFAMQMPFAIIIAAGLVLLALDIVGVKSGKSIGTRFILGAITSLLPFILIFIFITQLPAFLPWAYSLFPGQSIPPQVESMIRAVAANPIQGTDSQLLPVVGMTTATWGFGIGAYLFLVAAVMRIVAGFMMRTTPELQEKPAPQTENKQVPPLPPSPSPPKS